MAAQAAQAAGIKVNFFCINGLNAYTFLFIIYSLQYCLSQIRIRIRSKGFQIRFTGSSIYCMDKKYRLLSIYSSYIFLQNSEVLYSRSWSTTCTAWLLGYTPPLPVQPETEELIAEGVFFTSLTQRCPVQCQLVSALSGLL